jgi:transcriptional regulator with XRE-family HTH domain
MTDQPFAVVFAGELARRQLSDQQAADILRTSQPTVQRWRSGRVIPGPDRVATLAAFLDMRISEVEQLLATATRRPPAPARGDGETFADLLCRLEGERGWTVIDAIEHTGLERSSYYRWRRGRTTPRLPDIPDLAARLQTDEAEILWAIYRSELRVNIPR